MTTTTVNSLQSLALLYADRSRADQKTFESYVDTRFEDTFDILSRAAIKSYEVEVLGSGDAVLGVVLDANALPTSVTNKNGLTDTLLSALGMVRPEPIMASRVMVIGTDHTAIFPIPATYGDTGADKSLIEYYPIFYYSPVAFPIIPGSFVRCKFDKGTFQEGIITEHVNTLPPYVLSGEVQIPLRDMPDFGSASSFEDYLFQTGATPNADRLRMVMAQLGSSIYEKGQELASGGDITAELAAAASSVLSTIRVEQPHVTIRVTGGNDAFHHGLVCVGGRWGSGGRKKSGAAGKCYTSRHTRGRGLDFVLSTGRGPSDTDLDAIVAILRRHVAGNNGMFRFKDEYRYPTASATQPHLHFSWGEGTEGRKEYDLYLANQASSPWNDPIAV